MVEEGQYAVDFHANLSPLQAFSICVAILHGNSSFSGTGKAKNQQISRCNSLKMLLEEEVELFINSVTKEENKNVSLLLHEFKSVVCTWPKPTAVILNLSHCYCWFDLKAGSKCYILCFWLLELSLGYLLLMIVKRIYLATQNTLLSWRKCGVLAANVRIILCNTK